MNQKNLKSYLTRQESWDAFGRVERINGQKAVRV